MNNNLDKIKLFSLANSLAEYHLDKVENEFDLNLGRDPKAEIQKKDYYLQFDSNFRKEAKYMAEHYEVFYCLEKSIRGLILELMEEKYGENWWEEKVNEPIKKNVKDNIKRDEDSGFTIRSEEKIDYTTFGELSQIVTGNWEAFDVLFKRGQRSFQKIMTNLNQLRGPIAHCSPLAEDEVVRLELTVKDWFRLME
ncbi:Swt1 family HEPN domain-containing protein [Sphingobacterium sp. UGAL515B_05]|uniref:Swt1 family HEPN domain-containing protein n=1 Tax=Sphingobacterium sp. UGAL515B_05 TaxID=2986767 RepID=UPI002955DD27|nr:Swt1 family HEPN domain-containing protein [Sphingobacterium sp. UGAL515B_05]WON93647.1 Swt1 family HEPN domain-containing protein [Sphingobacterium sp. UGAL515B_05]